MWRLLSIKLEPGTKSAFLYDVILHTFDPDDHVDLLDQTLVAHFQSGIKLKAKKTIFFEKAMDYRRFKVDQEGIKMTNVYAQQIKDWPQQVKI